jgi:hypothetical protein
MFRRFAEFWQDQHGQLPPLLIFDSQLTTYRILDQIDKQGVRFITLRRRGKALMRSRAIGYKSTSGKPRSGNAVKAVKNPKTHLD